MDAILDLLLSLAPRLLVCLLVALAAILFTVWLAPGVKSWVLICISAFSVVVGMSWEIYGRRKKHR